MKSLIFYSMLISVFILSSCQEDIVLNDQTQEISKSNLGINTISWISPYLGASKVHFVNQNGQLKVFAIERGVTNFTPSPFYKNWGESFNLLLTDEFNASNQFSFRPVGNDHLYIGNKQIPPPLEPPYIDKSLIMLSYGPAIPSAPRFNAYVIQFNVSGTLWQAQNYIYGSNYPLGGDDEMYINIPNEFLTTVFFKSIYMVQGTGIKSFLDREDMLWTLVKVE